MCWLDMLVHDLNKVPVQFRNQNSCLSETAKARACTHSARCSQLLHSEFSLDARSCSIQSSVYIQVRTVFWGPYSDKCISGNLKSHKLHLHPIAPETQASRKLANARATGLYIRSCDHGSYVRNATISHTLITHMAVSTN